MEAQVKLPILSFILRNYHNYNARALRDAAIGYWKYVQGGGKMFWAVAGAMSSAQLGIVLAPAIREGLIHGMSVTGANLEESLVRLTAHDMYVDIPNYRYLTKEDEEKFLNDRMRRVTDMAFPEDKVYEPIADRLAEMFKAAGDAGVRRFWHEYFYDLVKAWPPQECQGDRDACWLLAAAEHNIPIVVPGYEDSTMGNAFSALIAKKKVNPSVVKSGAEYMAGFYDVYRDLSGGEGIGFFQIGGGISGDFPICVIPSLRVDMGEESTKDWGYFCQISDSTTSYGSYSGATPNEKITWEKVNKDTPMFVIESDATVVAPLILTAMLEAKRNPELANKLIAEFGPKY